MQTTLLRTALTLHVLLVVGTTTGCADDDPNGDQDSASGGDGATGGDRGTGGTDTGGTGGMVGRDAGQAFPEVGVCRHRSEATVSPTDFEGYEELYLRGDDGFGEDLCVVRIDVDRIGEAPDGCVDLQGEPCEWTHLVEYSSPTVVVDIDNACADSELALDEDALAELSGSQVAYGFVSELSGHGSAAMRYDADSDTWSEFSLATWDQATSAFRFDASTGFCGY